MNKMKEPSEWLDTKSKKNGKYKYVKSVIGQYIKGQIRAGEIFSKKPTTIDLPRSQELTKPDNTVTQESIIFQPCSNSPNSCSSKNSKILHKNVEICAPNMLCLNFDQKNDIGSVHYLTDEKSMLLLEFRELKRISAQNQNRISNLIQKLNELKLSISLLNEEQQRLEHSREIRTIGLKLLNKMLEGKYDDEKETDEKREQFEREKQIIEKILEQLARLEKVKMKLEYENVRNLYTIKELKKENGQLEKIKNDLQKELNFIVS